MLPSDILGIVPLYQFASTLNKHQWQNRTWLQCSHINLWYKQITSTHLHEVENDKFVPSFLIGTCDILSSECVLMLLSYHAGHNHCKCIMRTDLLQRNTIWHSRLLYILKNVGGTASTSDIRKEFMLLRNQNQYDDLPVIHITECHLKCSIIFILGY